MPTARRWLLVGALAVVVLGVLLIVVVNAALG